MQKQVCSFLLDGRLFGIDILDVREICNIGNLRKVHHAKTCIKGLMNVRGHLNLVVDLRELFGFANSERGSQTKVLLLKNHLDEGMGLLVDEVKGIDTVDWDQIQDRRKTSAVESVEKRKTQSKLSRGIVYQNDHLMVVVHTQNLLNQILNKGVENVESN